MTMRHLQRTRRASAEPGAEPSAPEPGQEQLPGSGVGVLILRVWSEGTAADRQMRMRIVSREDVTSDLEQTVSLTSRADSVAYIQAWLERFPLP